MRAAAGVVLAVALLVPAACGSDEPAASPSPKASPSPTVPAGLVLKRPEPPAGEADTLASAAEYGTFFAHLVQYAIRSRDSSVVSAEAFDQASCTTCQQLADYVGDLRSKGQWELADDIDLGRVNAHRAGSSTRATGDFTYPASKYVTLDGTVKERSPAEQYRLDAQLRWDAGAERWRVVDYTFDDR